MWDPRRVTLALSGDVRGCAVNMGFYMGIAGLRGQSRGDYHLIASGRYCMSAAHYRAVATEMIFAFAVVTMFWRW